MAALQLNTHGNGVAGEIKAHECAIAQRFDHTTAVGTAGLAHPIGDAGNSLGRALVAQGFKQPRAAA